MKLKSLVIAGVIAVALTAAFSFYVIIISQPKNTEAAGKAYSAGDITVRIIEDNSKRFLAKVENKGLQLNNTVAFAVKKGLDESCEPQGIVVSNFQLSREGDKSIPKPDFIPGHSSVTIDSSAANLNTIPAGDNNIETTVYILKLRPNSILVSDVVQKIPVQQLNSTEQQLFENCLKKADKGYPVLLNISNLQKGSATYFTLADQNGRKYETSLSVSPDASLVNSVFWPTSRQGWLGGNFTIPSGPVPALKASADSDLTLTVKTVIDGHVQEFEQPIKMSEDRLHVASLDFIEVAKGNPVPLYPKFWEVQVDLQAKKIS